MMLVRPCLHSCVNDCNARCSTLRRGEIGKSTSTTPVARANLVTGPAPVALAALCLYTVLILHAH